MHDNVPVTGAGVEVVLTAPLPRGHVWDLVTDLALIAACSPECHHAAWLTEGTPAARPGARFEGRNRYPDGTTASVICEVTEAEPGSVFAWMVLDPTGDPRRPASLWRYDLTPAATPGHTVVRHRFTHGPGDSGARDAARRDPAGFADRLAALRHNMARTLDAMITTAGSTAPAEETHA
ncbi:SRPBCC family protein [Streptomyces sp. RFCAC02]|uniref:SRPBCC family protein n=1 Tax=Streptomyces sp. RFCAC02 TaxID=2499143 RepID=UPI001021472F|nr:SRPBCC family protein [Streptomyces sp. RFCAC02]